MTESNQAAVGLVVKLPFATPEEFLAKYGGNITRGGIYLRARAVKPPGTAVTLDLRLAGGERIIYASAVVHFVTGQGGQGVVGMGLRFLNVDPQTRRFLDSAVVTLPHAQSDTPPVPNGVGPADYTVPPTAPPVATVSPAPAAGAPAGGAPAAGTPGRAPAQAAPAAPAGPVMMTDEALGLTTEEPKRTGPVIGIDLGTTNSCAALVRNGRPGVLPSREGHNTVPSIIAVNTRGKLVVGHPAKGQMLTNPRQTVYGAKRLVGRPYASPVVEHIKDRFHYEIIPGANGDAGVKLGDRVYTLQQISALILREVREVAQNQLGHLVSRAVVTVPAYYNDNQRQAVREAGKLAGLYVERILNEPTAAALAYGYGRKLNQRVLVYDLGGGTFDASVLELSDNVYEVISTGGDTFLGGLDFDNAIVAYLLEEFQKKTGRPFQGDRVAMQRINDAAERAKCALSERSEMRVHVAFVTMIDDKPYDLDVTLTRQKLIELTEGLVDRTVRVCEEVLKTKGLGPKDVDEVILVGGQSRFPLVHEKITRFFGKPPSKGVHPDEAVALGAALLAHSLGQLEGVVLIDVLPMAIGVGLPGGRFKPVLERNLSLPSTKSYTVATHRDDQTELELTVLQGDSDKAADNEFLGTIKLTGLPRKPRGGVQVAITFEVNNESLLKVTARETSTGREVTSTFNTRATPEVVKAKLSQLEAEGAHAPAAHAGAVATGPAAPVRAPATNGAPSTATNAPAAAPKHTPARGTTQAPPPVHPVPAVAATAPKQKGFMGWLKGLFGRA
ncbi:TIGR02266 family protein [Pyxidicoccus fallax]|uniref:TIGR02266 family protein n=1 Tax=Pyxidicoccus fallax TaxID=394095 RepID=A0A848L4F4_9BACT|nr:TIGR02266 family protein [Pyxidicoccus fallax]NMO13594.1 TIGR02266 family protein [Pyxidicoccus fallax]NPC76875.1 TIGR02266 family protein [Pyxidicoccus fallax]